MSTTTITSESLQSTIGENDIVILDFWAAWCGPCRNFAPVFEQASEQNDDIVFGKVDTEAEQKLAGAFGITSIPTLMVFREGVGVFRQAGALAAPQLEELISGVRSLNMEDVHKQVEEQKAKLAQQQGQQQAPQQQGQQQAPQQQGQQPSQQQAAPQQHGSAPGTSPTDF